MLPIKIYINLLLCVVVFIALSSCDNKDPADPHAAHQENNRAVYTCPMHPQIIKNSPGSCPICGMVLIKKENDALAIHGVELNALLKPSNEFVVSRIPVTTIQEREENIELDLLGTIAYDTRQVGTISSRVTGRIERLYLRYRYQKVVQGQKVMDIYSPELVTAQQNLLFLLKNDSGNSILIQAAKERLSLLGMTAGQIMYVTSTRKAIYSLSVFSSYSGFLTDLPSSVTDAVAMKVPGSLNDGLTIKEGMYVQKGQSVFSVYNADKVWILLNVFPEQQNLIRVGYPVRVIPETAPQQDFRAKIDYIEPVFRPGNKTLTARVYFNNTALKLPIGSRVTATVFASSQHAAWLPREAVLSLGREKVVFIKEPGGFRAKQVASGIEINNSIQILSGLSPSDTVAINAQFLVDNEAFIKAK